MQRRRQQLAEETLLEWRVIRSFALDPMLNHWVRQSWLRR
jgi:hypothetical protein